MGFWDSASVSADNLARLGPFVNGVVGTEGKYSVLNDAIAAGWTKILLATGASLNATVYLATGTSIISLSANVTIAGNYRITVAGDDCYLEGFKLSNNAGLGFYITGARARFYRVQAVNCLSHGFHFDAASGDHEMFSCLASGNGGDGVRFGVSNTARVSMLRSQSNTGWGIMDLTNVLQLSCSKISGNTAGQISGTTTYHDHSVKLT